jgi:hypothetical protein
MDAGAEVANLNRYDGRVLDDGSQMEMSALQRISMKWPTSAPTRFQRNMTMTARRGTPGRERRHSLSHSTPV